LISCQNFPAYQNLMFFLPQKKYRLQQIT